MGNRVFFHGGGGSWVRRMVLARGEFERWKRRKYLLGFLSSSRNLIEFIKMLGDLVCAIVGEQNLLCKLPFKGISFDRKFEVEEIISV